MHEGLRIIAQGRKFSRSTCQGEMKGKPQFTRKSFDQNISKPLADPVFAKVLTWPSQWGLGTSWKLQGASGESQESSEACPGSQPTENAWCQILSIGKCWMTRIDVLIIHNYPEKEFGRERPWWTWRLTHWPRPGLMEVEPESHTLLGPRGPRKLSSRW